jgi:hypothetical protein
MVIARWAEVEWQRVLCFWDDVYGPESMVLSVFIDHSLIRSVLGKISCEQMIVNTMVESLYIHLLLKIRTLKTLIVKRGFNLTFLL